MNMRKPSFDLGNLKTADDFLTWSIFFAIIMIIVSLPLGWFVQVYDPTVAQKMLELTINLDGVLFGFSAVMVGFFFHSYDKISKPNVKRGLWWGLAAFWMYIMSILFAFMAMSNSNPQATGIPIFTPTCLTIFGSIFTSICIMLIFLETIFPVENEPGQKRLVTEEKV